MNPKKKLSIGKKTIRILTDLENAKAAGGMMSLPLDSLTVGGCLEPPTSCEAPIHTKYCQS